MLLREERDVCSLLAHVTMTILWPISAPPVAAETTTFARYRRSMYFYSPVGRRLGRGCSRTATMVEASILPFSPLSEISDIIVVGRFATKVKMDFYVALLLASRKVNSQKQRLPKNLKIP